MGENNKEISEMYLMDGDKPIMQIDDIQEGDLKYRYNTEYKSRLDRYDGSFCIDLDLSKPTDIKKIYKAIGVDDDKIPDKCDIQILKSVPCRWHKKKRINKKMIKKHGHPNYVHRFETVKGWKLNTYTDGLFEFVKDGDKL